MHNECWIRAVAILPKEAALWDKCRGGYKMHLCHLIAQTGSSAPPHMPSIMDANQSIAVPSTGFAGRPKRESSDAVRLLTQTSVIAKDKWATAPWEDWFFLSNRRPWRGIVIVARSEEEWTVDRSGFPLLHYVSDINNLSLTNRKKSGISWWFGPNKAVKHFSADAFQYLFQLSGF